MTIDEISKRVHEEAVVSQIAPDMYQVVLPYEILGEPFCILIKRKNGVWRFTDNGFVMRNIERKQFLKSFDKNQGAVRLKNDEFFLHLGNAETSEQFEFFVSRLMGILGDYHREKINANDVAVNCPVSL